MENWDVIELVVSLDEPDQSYADSMKAFSDELLSENWVPQAPEFIDEVDDTGILNAEDLPIRTTGLVLLVLAPFSGHRRLPPSEDQRQFKQAERFLNAMSQYSVRTGARLRVHYNGEEIGEIAGRDLSMGVVQGLLEPWRKEVGL